MASTTTAYTRSLKPASGERRPPPANRAAKALQKIEPKKLGIGLAAGCCLALLTYLSLAKLFAIYSPAFEYRDSSKLVLATPPPPADEPLTGAPAAKGRLDEEEDDGIADPNPTPVPKQVDVSNGDGDGASTEAMRPFEGAKETKHADVSNGDEMRPFEGRKETQASKNLETKIVCDDKSVDEGFPYARPVVCEMTGDIRISPAAKSVFFLNPSNAGEFDANGERKIRPYARHDAFLLPGVVEVTLKSVPTADAAPACGKRYSVPAVVFSVAGYTGNFFHDMTDVMIPLFLTSSHFNGEVQYFITNWKPWWVDRYQPLLKKLSNYPVINFDGDDGVHCFSNGFVGMFRDRDLIIHPHPTRNPRNYSMVDFTKFLRSAYGLKRASPIVLGEVSGVKPRMLIINRTGTRKLLNLYEVAALSEDLGFEVLVSEIGADTRKFAELVNSCDVLLAVHGAGLTNQIFLPTKGVLVQIVPWGKMDWMATNFYGQPARDMGLRYVEYYVSETETTLADKYPRDHLVFTNPMAIHAQGWGALADIIMKQDVKVNVTRFKPFLLEAVDKLQE